MKKKANMNMTARLMFRLLPIQILLAAVGAINGIVTSLFAANSVGSNAMSAVGLYNPISLFIGAVNTVLIGGSMILCGQYMGMNLKEKTQNVFSLNIAVSVLVSLLLIAFHLAGGLLMPGGFMTKDPVLWPLFRQFLLGQAIGVLPLILGSQLSSFLSLVNQTRRATIASLIYIAVNVVLNYLFLQVMHLEAFGLALASSLGMWVFFLVQLLYFLRKDAELHFSLAHPAWSELAGIARIGVPGAMGSLLQTVRGLIVNGLILTYVGNAGLSAFSTANSFLGLFWAIPGGMLNVSRMLFSVSVGEEDRQTLADIMRVAMFRFVPLMTAVSAVIIFLAVPCTHLYFRDPSAPVYDMTVWGFRILPLCMPLSIIAMHFSCYWQASDRNIPVHVIAVMDGALTICALTAVMIPVIGMNSVYIANVLNGVVTAGIILAYAWIRNRHFPRNMEELMVIPENFGVPEEDRLDMSVSSMEDVVGISDTLHEFCLRKGLDRRRSFMASLFLEEMAGNVVAHGFTKDNHQHSADIRISYKDNGVILRIKDDCIPFNPSERQAIIDPDDIARNVGIRMVYRIAEKVEYNNILGMNVLTIRI